MEKLTDAEVMAALKCCIYDRAGCKGCPLYGDGSPNCWEAIRRNALDLINRKDVEIDELTADCEKYKAERDEFANHIGRIREMAKSEAYKEVLERVRRLWGNYEGYEFETKFNNLAKELTEGNK